MLYENESDLYLKTKLMHKMALENLAKLVCSRDVYVTFMLGGSAKTRGLVGSNFYSKLVMN